MENTLTLGEIRNLLAGLGCDVLSRVAGPDDHPVHVSTGFESLDGHRCYALVVELPAIPSPRKRPARRGVPAS
jgi:hypothetical protein